MWERVYSDCPRGMVCETNADKAEVLAWQRPTWSVYETPAEVALACGAGAELPVELLDVDPYGSPWETIGAFFNSTRIFPDVLGVAVNDGLRQSLQLHAGWRINALREALLEFGNTELYPSYLAVARWNLGRLAAPRGYEVTHWAGYHCGAHQAMTHYAAVLVRGGGT